MESKRSNSEISLVYVLHHAHWPTWRPRPQPQREGHEKPKGNNYYNADDILLDRDTNALIHP
jgi:hypothetical protein